MWVYRIWMMLCLWLLQEIYIWQMIHECNIWRYLTKYGIKIHKKTLYISVPGSNIVYTKKQLIRYISFTILWSNAYLDVLTLHIRFPRNITRMLFFGFTSCVCSYFNSILDCPGSSISFNPTDESITKVLGQSLGPIVCSAQCIPPCQFHWIKTDGTVVDWSTLEIQSLSKNDHGTFTCHTGNGYCNNGTQNLNITVNCKYLMLNTILWKSNEMSRLARLLSTSKVF